MVSALGASVLIENGIMLIWGANVHVFPSGLLPATTWNVGGASITFVQVMIIVVSVLLMAALYLFVHHTRFGTAIRAAAIDQDTARLMGINVNRVIASVFVIGPALGAIGGLFIGIYYREAYFTMGWTYGLYAFIAAILGGIGNIPGAMLGGVLLGLFNAFAAGYVSSSWQDAITFGLLIAILLVRPTGIAGRARGGESLMPASAKLAAADTAAPARHPPPELPVRQRHRPRAVGDRPGNPRAAGQRLGVRRRDLRHLRHHRAVRGHHPRPRRHVRHGPRGVSRHRRLRHRHPEHRVRLAHLRHHAGGHPAGRRPSAHCSPRR